MLKLLSNNDIQGRIRSRACFFAWARLLAPDKVHSFESRKYFPAVAPVSPSVVLQLDSHHNHRPAAATKKTGVTLRAMSMFRWLTLAPDNRWEATLPRKNSAKCKKDCINEIQTVPVPQVPLFQGESPRTCFCPALPIASLLKSNNCLLFTRLTSARRNPQGYVQHAQRYGGLYNSAGRVCHTGCQVNTSIKYIWLLTRMS